MMGADMLAGVSAGLSQAVSGMDVTVRTHQPDGAAGGVRAADALLLTPDAATTAAGPGPSFTDALGRALDNLSGALSQADALAAGVAVNRAGVAQAAIARAKADTILEIAAIAAARVSGVITQLLQTQV
jgi:flagellar hook-basal body complex protein FliE